MSDDTHNSESHDLDWLAFRYIAEEMTPDEQVAFEDRLADEQPAREAVARAVEMSLAVQDVFADNAAVALAERETNPGHLRRGWLHVALAGGGLLALALVSQLAGPQPAKPPTAKNSAHELAIAWSETRSVWQTSALTEGEDDAFAGAGSDDDLAGAPPTWMLAAVSESTMNMPEEGEGDEVPE